MAWEAFVNRGTKFSERDPIFRLAFAAELSELRSIDIKNRKAICVAILASATPNEIGVERDWEEDWWW